MIAKARMLEALLKNSKELKDEGFNNTDIRKIEIEGFSPQYYRFITAVGTVDIQLQQGDRGHNVDTFTYWKIYQSKPG